MLTLNNILTNLPEYAKDIRLNLTSFITNHDLLSHNQFYGTLLTTALASKNPTVITAIQNEASNYLNEQTINGAKAAATIMAMTNIYYRFTDLVEDHDYSKMPAGLRMNIMRDHGTEKIDFEIWSLAVSIINGCSMCISAHEKQLISHGISKEAIQLIAKIAATIHALARAHEAIQ